MPNVAQQTGQLMGLELTGRTAAQEESLHGPGLTQGSQFGSHGVQIGVDEMVLAHGDGKITVVTALSAEGYVQVTGPRELPGGAARFR